jgi:CBS domain-containing protein
MGESAHQKTLETIPAKDVMNTDVITTSPDAPLAEACAIMIEKKIGCLPVIENRTLVGILTEGDLLAILSRAEYNAA